MEDLLSIPLSPLLISIQKIMLSSYRIGAIPLLIKFFPIQPSLAHFISEYDKDSPKEREKLIDDYEMMQEMPMNIYDFSDVAYDAFLLNGHTKCDPWTAPVKVGDTVLFTKYSPDEVEIEDEEYLVIEEEKIQWFVLLSHILLLR